MNVDYSMLLGKVRANAWSERVGTTSSLTQDSTDSTKTEGNDDVVDQQQQRSFRPPLDKSLFQ
jgi:hypothetical protein